MKRHIWLLASLISLTACGGGGDDDSGSNNTAPIAEQQVLSLNEDGTKSITLNGSDADGDTLSYTVMTQPTNGLLSDTAPTLTYTPNNNYHGSDSFTFKVNDGTVDSATAMVTLSIDPENDAPLAEAQAVNLLVGSTKAITLTGSDVDMDTLSYTVVTQPLNGALSGTAPNLTYTPSGSYSGSDSFTFKVNDGSIDSTPATVSLTITITPINNAPLAEAQTVNLQEDSAKAITLVGSDLDGDTLSYAVVTQPTSGTLSGTAPNLTYIPTADYSGSDSFTFKVNDGVVDSIPATIMLTIAPVNDVPTADNLTVTLSQDSNKTITLTGSDVEGDALTFTVQTQPTNGTLSGTSPNLTYTPNSGYTGTDSFTYISNDGEEDSLVATVAITINAITTSLQMPLNDTGITWGGNYPSGNNTTCIGETIAQQDCSHGRDTTHNDDSDGHAGFSYTKLDANGNALASTATQWSCVKDNVTGLIWETKIGGNGIKGDEGLHDADDRYNWYNTDPTSNGGTNGYANDDGAICHAYDANNSTSYCNTQAYTARVNSTGLCGANDWRMPTKTELRNLVNLNQANPAIDTDYFPATRSSSYWSASPYASNSFRTWYVHFLNGFSYSDVARFGANHVRLVRAGQ